MAAPSSPYCTGAQVAQLLKVLYKGAAPSGSTTPDDTDVDFAISGVAARIEEAFRKVGYKVPFLTLTGETWPTGQTSLLTWMNAMGAAGTVGGSMLKPAPAVGPGRTGSMGNVYEAQFQQWLDRVVESGGGSFRAQYYSGTQAEHNLNEPRAPLLSFTEEAYDRATFALMEDIVEMLEDARDDFLESELSWDFMYDKRADL